MVGHYFLAIAVFDAANGMIWASDSKELSKNDKLEYDFPAERTILRFGWETNVSKDVDYEDPAMQGFDGAPAVTPSSKPSSHLRIAVTTSNGSAVSSVDINPNLVVVYMDLVKRLSVGIILKRRTVLTTCVSTLLRIEGQLFSIKPDFLVILAGTTVLGVATVQPVNLVAEIRRHPFCGSPFVRGTPGPWMNDLAILILHAELIQPFEPLEMASENVYNIFSDVQKRISTEDVCQAIGIEFKNSTSAFHGTSLDVRIVDHSTCSRLCGYMIPQCEPQIGGYFVQFVSLEDKFRMEDWMAEAALVCDGKLYGVVSIFGFACDASLAGLAPKPEAVLLMHLSTANLLTGPSPTKQPPRRKQSAAGYNRSRAVWVIVATLWIHLNKL